MHVLVGLFSPRHSRWQRGIPVYKKGTRTDINNYRPISIFPLLSNLLEHIIKTGLVSLTNYSAMKALIDFVEKVLETLDKSKWPSAVFLS